MSDQEYAAQRYRAKGWDDNFLDGIVRERFDADLHLPSISQASIQMVRDRIKTTTGIRVDDYAAVVRLILDAVREGGVICEIDTAQHDGWRTSNFLQFGAATSMVRDEAIERAQQRLFTLDAATDWCNLINKLGKQQSWQMKAEVQAQFEDSSARSSMIAKITNGGTSGFKLRTQYGGIRVFDKDGYEVQFSSAGGRSRDRVGGFENMSTDQIRETYNAVVGARQLKDMPVEDLRKMVRENGQQAFERSTVSARPASSDVELLDPNGFPIETKRELIQYINSSKDATRKLLMRNGKIDPARARKFERILNSND